MKGEVVLIQSTEEGTEFGIKLQKSIFPVDTGEIFMSGLVQGKEVLFQTDKETGNAIIIHPGQVVGCTRA